jgi:hypothetical protein
VNITSASILSVEMIRNLCLLALVTLIFVGTGGCIERILTIQTNPSGALVEANGQEFGRTPASRDFTWYGTYDITIRMDGYETLQTTGKVIAPIYEWIPLDLITELLPIPFKDHHVLTYTLTPSPPASEPSPGILRRAEELKGQMEPTHYPGEKKSK